VRIGLLTTSFPRHEGDIAGAFVLGFARALAERGHMLEVLAPEPSDVASPPRWPGVRVHWVPYMRPRSAARTFYGAGVPDNLRTDPRAWLGVLPFAPALLAAALRRRSQWDSLISHFGVPCGSIASAICGARPHLCVLHSADLHLLSRLPLRGAIAAQIAAGASQLLFVSRAQQDRFLHWLTPAARMRARSIAHVQPMGIDAPAPRPAARAALRRALGLSSFTLLSVGRLVPVKGLREALRELADRADLQWLIAGDGPERAQLTAIAASARLRIRLLGTVTGAEKQRLLHAADAFVLPSRTLPSGRSEGVPTAALEAMAHGLPVIAAATGGIGEVVRHLETGLSFDPEVAHALERCVNQLMLDPALRSSLAQRGQREAMLHRWPRLAPRFEAALTK
jgi:glycosyltransferase involved in cell wall biosynthesis